MKTRVLLTEFIDQLLYKIVIEHRHVSDVVDMPDSWYRTIRFLDKADSASMREIAEFLHVSTPRATMVGNALVDAGYAKRLPGVDRRTIRLKLTQRGYDIIDKTTRVHQHLSEHILAELTDNERETFYSLLKKCNEAAKTTTIDATEEECVLLQQRLNHNIKNVG